MDLEEILSWDQKFLGRTEALKKEREKNKRNGLRDGDFL